MIQHQDYAAFLEDAQPHAPIGRAIVSLSDLEFSHDQFILAVNKKHPQIARRLSASFPRHFKKKTDFLVRCFSVFPGLHAVPIFGDGSANLLWLQYQLDELYEVRAVIAHGSIFYSEQSPDGAVYRFDRVVSPEKGRWGEASHRVGTYFLADVVATCTLLKHYMHDLCLTIHEEYSWNKVYKDEIETKANRDEMREWVEYGIIVPDPLLTSLLRMDEP